MPDWLRGASSSPTDDPSVLILFWRIGVGLLLGAIVAALYRWARRGERVAPTFLSTLVLLAAAIAMATQIIGDNVARAFSLVGALSVVRFRTVVKDTQDTAFVILAVVVGMASGADHVLVALVGLVVVGVAALFLWPRPVAKRVASPRPERVSQNVVRKFDARLFIKLDNSDSARAAVEQLLAATIVEPFELLAASVNRRGSSVSLEYGVRTPLSCPIPKLVVDLKRLEGVQEVEFERKP